MSARQDERASDSPLVARITRVRYESDWQGFTTPDGCWDLVVRKVGGRVHVLQTGIKGAVSNGASSGTSSEQTERRQHRVAVDRPARRGKRRAARERPVRAGPEADERLLERVVVVHAAVVRARPQ